MREKQEKRFLKDVQPIKPKRNIMMNYQNPRRLVLPLAVLFALAACGGQSNEAPKAAPGASEAAVQTASPAVAENAASNAASTASAPAASAVVADSNASPEDQELLKRA